MGFCASTRGRSWELGWRRAAESGMDERLIDKRVNSACGEVSDRLQGTTTPPSPYGTPGPANDMRQTDNLAIGVVQSCLRQAAVAGRLVARAFPSSPSATTGAVSYLPRIAATAWPAVTNTSTTLRPPPQRPPVFSNTTDTSLPPSHRTLLRSRLPIDTPGKPLASIDTCDKHPSPRTVSFVVACLPPVVSSC